MNKKFYILRNYWLIIKAKIKKKNSRLNFEPGTKL